jgi:cytochrome P450 family 135
MRQLTAKPTGSDRSATTLPPGPRLPGPVQTVWYTFAQPSFFAACRARFGEAWTLRLPGFPPLVVTRDRDAIRRLFTGDPLVRRHGNDLFKSAFGERSVMLLDPAEHLERRRLELPPFHGRRSAHTPTASDSSSLPSSKAGSPVKSWSPNLAPVP